MKAIEAAAGMKLKEKLEDCITAAFRQYASYEDARQAGIASIAADACLSVITALAEDDAAVERVARAICMAQEGNTNAYDWPRNYEREALQAEASAAIRAMGGE